MEQCQALYHLTTRLILLARMLSETGWPPSARSVRTLPSRRVCTLLQQGVRAWSPAAGLWLSRQQRTLPSWTFFTVPSDCSSAARLCWSWHRCYRRRSYASSVNGQNQETCAKLATILTDFPQCVPREEGWSSVCQQLVRTFAYFHCPATEERELREYVTQADQGECAAAGHLEAEPATLLPSLQEVFAIISSTGQ